MGAACEGVVALASGGGQEEVFDSEELALKKNLHRGCLKAKPSLYHGGQMP